MDAKRYEIRLNHWMSIIQAANDSPLSKSEWCKQNGITKRTFYYWQRKVQDRLIETGMIPQSAAIEVSTQSVVVKNQPVFCEITEPEPETRPDTMAATETDFRADAVIRSGSISVLINENTSSRTLNCLLSALRSDP